MTLPFQFKFLSFKWLRAMACLFVFLLTIAPPVLARAEAEKPKQGDLSIISPPSDTRIDFAKEAVSEQENLSTFSLYLENDYFSGEDGGYTNGLKLTWSSAVHKEFPPHAWPHRWLYPVVKWLPLEKAEDRKNITFSIGQNIYTPQDIEAEDIVEDDRPYAGITYLEMGFHNRREREMDTLELFLGLVGPHSYAEQAQKAVHQVFDDIDPKGWDNQLDDEPVIDIIYEHKKRMLQSGSGNGPGYDLILNTGGALGNALTYYNLGVGFRVGLNLPNDFGDFPIKPASSYNAAFDAKDPRYLNAHKIGIYVFTSIEGRAVLHNIFLDGNTFTDSHSVTKKPLVADYAAGIGIIRGRAKVSFAYVIRTKEFETQKDPQQFGTASVSLSY